MSGFDTAKNIINAAAAEVGLTPVADPYVSTDPAFIQLRNILASAGREMISMHTWERLIKEATITTTLDEDEYDLPSDYAYMIDQTGWNRTQDMPLGGPLTAQTWAYVMGSGIGASTIYFTFRKFQGKIKLAAESIPAGQDIRYEYMSRNWVVLDSDDSETDAPVASDDIILYENVLISKFLKLRFLEAKGFDTTAASDQFTSQFLLWTGKDIPAPVLNLAGHRAFPYLGEKNIPETGFGS